MNYRHGFHAGNHADVLKHICVLALLDALMTKPAPLFVLDTHAGSGSHRLDSAESLRTGEWQQGIGRMHEVHESSSTRFTAPPILRYLDFVRGVRKSTAGETYPGSPWLIASRLREGDRLACCETQSDAVSALRRMFARSEQVSVHERDGYEATKALLPPKERRGLVLVDPPFEAQQAEFDRILESLEAALARWAGGCFAIWYPVKRARDVQPFFRRLAALPTRGVLDVQLLLRPAVSALAFNGSGIVVINPPWKVERVLEPAVKQIAAALGDVGKGAGHVAWIRARS